MTDSTDYLRRLGEREACAKCGFPRSEHHYNGACYGVCGEFVASIPAERGEAVAWKLEWKYKPSENRSGAVASSTFWNEADADEKLPFLNGHPDIEWVKKTALYPASVVDRLRQDIERLTEELDAAHFANRNGKSLAEDSIYAIRELLKSADVPLAAFIDDHVGNAIVQRNQAEARATSAESLLADKDRRIVGLEEALKPFARVAELLLAESWPRGRWAATLNGKEEAEVIPDSMADDDLLVTFGGEFTGGVSLDGLTLGDFRRARTTLSQEQEAR